MQLTEELIVRKDGDNMKRTIKIKNFIDICQVIDKKVNLIRGKEEETEKVFQDSISSFESETRKKVNAYDERRKVTVEQLEAEKTKLSSIKESYKAIVISEQTEENEKQIFEIENEMKECRNEISFLEDKLDLFDSAKQDKSQSEKDEFAKCEKVFKKSHDEISNITSNYEEILEDVKNMIKNLEATKEELETGVNYCKEGNKRLMENMIRVYEKMNGEININNFHESERRLDKSEVKRRFIMCRYVPDDINQSLIEKYKA